MDVEWPPVPLAECASIKLTPPTFRTCNLQPCTSVAYQAAEWDECTRTCNRGTQRRVALCRNGGPRGWTVQSSLCDVDVDPNATDVPSHVPHLVQACNVQPCTFYQFVAGPWRSCSARCGEGLQEREVVCIERDANEFRIVPDGFCVKNSKLAHPATKRLCRTTPCDDARWVVGPWSACPVRCGGGVQTRTVECSSADTSRCVAVNGPPPASEQPCLRTPCEDAMRDPCSAAKDDVRACYGNGECSTAQVLDLHDAKDVINVPACECGFRLHKPPLCRTPANCSGIADALGLCCAAPGVLDANGACCEPGKLSRHGECCPSGVANACGACCPDSPDAERSRCMKSFPDANGNCCPGALDEAGVCCPSGRFDECSVCSGDGASCLLQVSVTVEVPPNLLGAVKAWAGTDSAPPPPPPPEPLAGRLVRRTLRRRAMLAQQPAHADNGFSTSARRAIADALQISSDHVVLHAAMAPVSRYMDIPLVFTDGSTTTLPGWFRTPAGFTRVWKVTFSVVPGALVEVATATEILGRELMLDAEKAAGRRMVIGRVADLSWAIARLDERVHGFAKLPTRGGAVLLAQRMSENVVGVCGNGICERDERCIGASAVDANNVTESPSCCPADCPHKLLRCPNPLYSSVECGYGGVCLRNTGRCSCFAGYAGETCDECADGYVANVPVIDDRGITALYKSPPSVPIVCHRLPDRIFPPPPTPLRVVAAPPPPPPAIQANNSLMAAGLVVMLAAATVAGMLFVCFGWWCASRYCCNRQAERHHYRPATSAAAAKASIPIHAPPPPRHPEHKHRPAAAAAAAVSPVEAPSPMPAPPPTLSSLPGSLDVLPVDAKNSLVTATTARISMSCRREPDERFTAQINRVIDDRDAEVMARLDARRGERSVAVRVTNFARTYKPVAWLNSES